MSYLWVATVASLVGAGGARLMRRRRLILPSALLGGLLGAVVRASEPTLFRAENGFAGALALFGIPALVVGMVVGLLVRGEAKQLPE